MKRRLFTFGLALVLTSSAPAQARLLFECFSYRITTCDYFQCCTDDCTQCYLLDEFDNVVRDPGEPYCFEVSCRPRQV